MRSGTKPARSLVCVFAGVVALGFASLASAQSPPAEASAPVASHGSDRTEAAESPDAPASGAGRKRQRRRRRRPRTLRRSPPPRRRPKGPVSSARTSFRLERGCRSASATRRSGGMP